MIKKIINKLFRGKPESISFKQGMDLTDVPIVTLYQGDNKFNFILDTGSDVSVIDSNALSFIEHEVLQDIAGSLYGIDGNLHQTSVCRMSMFYKDQQLNLECLVKDMSAPFTRVKQSTGVNLHGMIGSLFFNKYKYVLDFNEMIAYSKA